VSLFLEHSVIIKARLPS